MNEKKRGFTLIEILVVVAILGVLVMVAYPAYSNYIKKGRQAGAHTLLEAGRLAMETFYGRNGAYPPSSSAVKDLPGYDPRSVNNTDPQARYRICIVNSAPTSFMLKAKCDPAFGCNVGDDEVDVWTINEQGSIKNLDTDPGCSGPAE